MVKHSRQAGTVTVVGDPTLGHVRTIITAVEAAPYGVGWWRPDVLDSAGRRTSHYGQTTTVTV